MVNEEDMRRIRSVHAGLRLVRVEHKHYGPFMKGANFISYPRLSVIKLALNRYVLRAVLSEMWRTVWSRGSYGAKWMGCSVKPLKAFFVRIDWLSCRRRGSGSVGNDGQFDIPGQTMPW